VIHIHKLTVDDAVGFICRAADLPQFRTTKESQRKMDDLALVSQIKAALVHDDPDIVVKSEYGNILIYTKADDRLSHKLEEKAKRLCRDLEGVNNLEVHPGARVPPPTLFRRIRSCRTWFASLTIGLRPVGQRLRPAGQDAVSLYILACKIFANFPYELKKAAGNSIDAADSISRNIIPCQ
jgi:hypothetical protein